MSSGGLPDIFAPPPQPEGVEKHLRSEAEQASIENEIQALRTTMGVPAGALDVPRPKLSVPSYPLQPCTRPTMSEPIRRPLKSPESPLKSAP